MYKVAFVPFLGGRGDRIKLLGKKIKLGRISPSAFCGIQEIFYKYICTIDCYWLVTFCCAMAAKYWPGKRKRECKILKKISGKLVFSRQSCTSVSNDGKLEKYATKRIRRGLRIEFLIGFWLIASKTNLTNVIKS